jgi:hypothetical protein
MNQNYDTLTNSGFVLTPGHNVSASRILARLMNPTEVPALYARFGPLRTNAVTGLVVVNSFTRVAFVYSTQTIQFEIVRI